MLYPEINPIAFHIPFIHWPVYWYGIMYLIGFALAWIVLSLRLRQSLQPAFTQDQLSDIIFYSALGTIIGGRVGYMLFYQLHTLFSEPLTLLQTWKGGMSFHGGLLGVLIAVALYARKLKKPFLALTDLVAPAVPLGLLAGRLGNFINGELWGRVTTLPWGVIFPEGGPVARHPSQLYEALFEGLILFIILWWYSRKPRPLGAVSGMFALFYGIFRIAMECFREPDAHIGFLANHFTQGQLLSAPLVIIGVLLIYFAYSKDKRST